MSIDEAIAHAREKANEMYLQGMLCHANPNDDKLDGCIECGREHEQIAEWLEELKDYQDKNKMVVRVDVENVDNIENKIDELSKYAESQYNKALDDFVKEICKMIVQSENNGNHRFYAVEIKQAIVDLAEQLKEQKK